MPVELWGASGSFSLGLPDRAPGYLLLFLYLIGLGFVLYRQGPILRRLTSHQWLWLFILSTAAFVASQFLPFPFSRNTPTGQPAAYLTVLMAVPLLLSAILLPPAAALLVGMAAGFGQALGESHQLFDLFHYGFTAGFIAHLWQQNYIGRPYNWLRQPVVAGALSAVLLALLAGVGIWAAGPLTGLLALDRALVIAGATLWPRLVEGIFGGVTVMALLYVLPDLQSSRPLVPSPSQRSLQKRLTTNYVTFTSILIGLTLVVLYGVAVTISTRLLVHNVAQTARVVSPERVAEIEPAAAANAGRREYRYRIHNGNSWSPDDEALFPLWFAQPAQGHAYWGWSETPLTRELVVAVASEDEAHMVITAVPYTAVLQQAWGIGWPLLLVMMLAAALFYANVLVIGRDITTPLDDMVEASKTIAAGGAWSPSQNVQRDDEIGQLQRAFAQMQRSMRKRLNELSLLLGVSHDVATSIDISQGIPAILRGALRGTGASGARAVVPNPGGGNPMTFGEGPAAEQMAVLDRVIMTRLRHASELMLSTPEEIVAALDLESETILPVPALLAIPLRSHDRFQGILWLGFRQVHSFDLTERNLLSTLSTQAAVLVENARLFSTAESGRRRLAAVLSSTSDAVIVTDQTERILLVNPAAEKIFGLAVDMVRNRPVADVISNEPLAQALLGQDERPQNLEISTDDSKVYNAVASTIFSNEGQVFGRVAVLRDITSMKEIDKMKSDFVATVSHDLRSPLTFMRGYATMLPMVGELTDKQREYVDKITGGIDQMAQMVDDLLDLGRIEGGVDLEQNTFEIRPLLKDIASEYWQHAHLAGIQIQVEVDENISIVSGDLSLIRQAITNLLGNGLKYAPNSGPMILRAQQSNGEIIFSIKDNGPGISKEDQTRLFEKFYRVKARGTEKVKGSGLGLAIVKSIAERHGGRAWVQSQRGNGTTFFLSLPVRQQMAVPDHTAAS